MIHELKTWTGYFAQVLSGEKPFEVRRADRPYVVGDTLHLREWDNENGTYTGRETGRQVTSILPGGAFGIEHGYCVLGLGALPAESCGGASLTLPYPVTVNRYWTAYRGRMTKTREARDYIDAARQIASLKRLTMLTGPVGVKVHIYRPWANGDLDNALKTTLDSLTGVVYKDDRQIVRILAERHDDKANPRAEVTVTPLVQRK